MKARKVNVKLYDVNGEPVDGCTWECYDEDADEWSTMPGTPTIRQEADPQPANGGDFCLCTGVGHVPPSCAHRNDVKNFHGSFRFLIGGSSGEEFMRIDADGSFWVMGKKVATDEQVYSAFKAWLGAGYLYPSDAEDG